MNRQYRRYNRNQPNNQVRRSNFFFQTPAVNNTTPNNDSCGENDNRNNGPSDDKKKWQYADTIAVCALVVGVVMTIVTYRLFELSQKQAQSVIDGGDAAKRSVEIAKNTFEADTSFSGKTLRNQIESQRKAEIADTVKSRHEASAFNLQKQSVNAQIKTLREQQKEFEIENKPLVQVADVRIDTLAPGKRMSIRFSFINYGKQPVKGLVNKYQISVVNFKDTPNFTDKNSAFHTNNSYLSGGTLFNNYFTSGYILTNQDYETIRIGEFVIYLNGEFTFRNTVTNKISSYNYRKKLNYVGEKLNLEGIIDTTIEIVNKKQRPPNNN